jgi:hypothetical protein
MKELIEKWKKLAQMHPKRAKVYASASLLDIANCEKKIGYSLHSDLKEFLLLADGASIMDYLLSGCQSRHSLSLADSIQGVWVSIPSLQGCFFVFMGNSMSQSVGYWHDSTHFYIGYLPDLQTTTPFFLAHSLKDFLELFLSQVEKTLQTDPLAFYLEDFDWLMAQKI